MLTWAAFYGVHAAAFFYGLIVLRQLLAVEVRSPGWMSLRLLAAFGTIAVSMSALVTWLNLDGFRSVLGPDRRGADDRWRARRLAVRGHLHGPRAAAGPPAAIPRDRRDRVRTRARRVAGRTAVSSRRRRFHSAAAHAGRGAAGTGEVERARPHDSARRRVARFHRAERSGRPLSEFRPPARQRRGDAPRDASSHAAGARVDRGGHGKAALQDQRLFGRALRRARIRSAARSAS